MEMEEVDTQDEMMTSAFEMMEDPSAQADAEDGYNGILAEIGLKYPIGQAATPTNSIALISDEDQLLFLCNNVKLYYLVTFVKGNILELILQK